MPDRRIARVRRIVNATLILGFGLCAVALYEALANFSNRGNDFWGKVMVVSLYVTLAATVGWLALTVPRIVADVRRLWSASRLALLISAAACAALGVKLITVSRPMFDTTQPRVLFIVLGLTLGCWLVLRFALALVIPRPPS